MGESGTRRGDNGPAAVGQQIIDQGFLLAHSALKASGGNWSRAHESLRDRANRFAHNGDAQSVEALIISARIVRFYGLGY